MRGFVDQHKAWRIIFKYKKVFIFPAVEKQKCNTVLNWTDINAELVQISLEYSLILFFLEEWNLCQKPSKYASHIYEILQ